uniref:Uncharacterized protein n=1 Tax=Arundo donax TaxID=35708 RepID=A0A0A9E354_ARUDO
MVMSDIAAIVTTVQCGGDLMLERRHVAVEERRRRVGRHAADLVGEGQEEPAVAPGRHRRRRPALH